METTHQADNVGSTDSLHQLTNLVMRRRRLIAISFVSILAAAILGAVWFTGYEARLRIVVQHMRVDPVVSTRQDILQADTALTPDELSTELELLRSRDVLQQVVLDCRLYEPHSRLAVAKRYVLRILGLEPKREIRIFKAVIGLERDLEVIPMNNSNIIQATYDSADPNLSACVLDRLGKGYLAKRSTINTGGKTFNLFESQTQAYKNNLENAEARLIDFSQHGGVVSPDLEKQMVLQKLSEFDGVLRQTRAGIADTEQRIAFLNRQIQSAPARLTTQVRNSDNPQLLAALGSTLLQLELKRTQLLEQYQPEYRLVQDVDKQIAGTKAEIAAANSTPVREETTDRDQTYDEMRTELAKASAELAGLQARASVMEDTVRAYREKSVRVERQGIVKQDLMRAAKLEEDNYLLYHRKREEARITDALDQIGIINAVIAEPAIAPLAPAGPSLPVKLVLATLLSSLMSLGIAIAADHLDPSFRIPDDVESYLSIPVLSAIPNNGHISGNGDNPKKDKDGRSVHV